MSQISLIAVIDEAGGLGRNNQLLVHSPADLQYFKSVTLGKPIVMGHGTYQSIGRPLPGRTNIVLSRTEMSIPNVTVVGSLEQAFASVSTAPEIMIIGGAQLYRQTIHLASSLYITHIHHQFKADVFFPEIDKTLWMCVQQTFRAHDESNPYDMTFCLYKRVHNSEK